MTIKAKLLKYGMLYSKSTRNWQSNSLNMKRFAWSSKSDQVHWGNMWTPSDSTGHPEPLHPWDVSLKVSQHGLGVSGGLKYMETIDSEVQDKAKDSKKQPCITKLRNSSSSPLKI